MQQGKFNQNGSSCNFKCSNDGFRITGLWLLDFTSDTAVETEAQTDEFDAADDTADAFAGDEETSFC